MRGVGSSHHEFQEQSLKKNKRSSDMLESVECRYSLEVVHVKILSPWMKDVVLYFLHLILMYYRLWMCDVVERGMKGVYFEFHYE